MHLAPLPAAAFATARDALRVWWTLMRIMVPVMVVVKLAADFGAIPLLAGLFEPAMSLVGLPAEMGVVWAAACLTTIYGGIAVLPTVLPEASLTGAQMTVLGTMVLVAHSLPVEGRICQRAGTALAVQTVLRLAGALVFGMLLHVVYGGFGLLQQPLDLSWLPQAPPETGWLGWAETTAMSLALMLAVIAAIMALMRLLDAVGGNRLLSAVLSPVLRLMGIGPQAVQLTVIGTLLGISYGGGLILKEVERGTLSRRDVFLCVSFMALTHSLIEDSLIIIALGGHWSGVVVGRLVLTIAVIAVLARVVHRLPDSLFERLLMSRIGRPAPQPAPAAAA